MLKFYPSEIFKEIEVEKGLLMRYAISNYGRFVSFFDEIKNGNIVKGGKQDGYRIWRYKVRDENNKICYKYSFFYKLVAEYFIPKTSDEQKYVLHLDYSRSNDNIDNLKWATYAEMIAHGKKSPYVIAARKKQLPILWAAKSGSKLTETEVMFLKKKLLDPERKTRIKILAKQFGVTTTQLRRIKTGENWGNVKV